ncbi:hypothetical protein Q1695_001565 [Nippostrongylus brasiliensis]|nr:hypothetical protein Q1695_001565 [Nippostrongylus brasiliensis]
MLWRFVAVQSFHKVIVSVLIVVYSAASVKVGIFLSEPHHQYVRGAVQFISDAINDRTITFHRECTFDPVFVRVNFLDHEEIRQKVCEVVQSGATVIIGPPRREYGRFIETLCRELSIAYIKYYWAPTKDIFESETNSTFNLFPTSQFSILIDNLLLHWRWEQFTFVYTSNEATWQLNSIFARLPTTPSLVKVDDSTERGLMVAALTLRDICDWRFCWVKRNKVIIDMNPDNTLRFLDAALKLGMISIHNWFIISSLDNLDTHLEQYVHNAMRLSLITIWTGNIDPQLQDHIKIKELYSKWRKQYGASVVTPFKEFAYLFDAVVTSCHINPSSESRRTCERTDYVTNRDRITVEPDRGLTGLLSFNETGEREDNKLQIWELGMNGNAINTGTWSSDRTGSRQLLMKAASIPGTQEYDANRRYQARVLRVSTIAERPYVIEKILPSGKIAYEGFCVDLLDRLAASLHISYEISIVKDNKYGEPAPNNASEWDGMIGEVLRGEADMAVGPITVTARRLEVVDFTDPFLQLGISMLMRQPSQKASSSLTSFLRPLTASVWTFSATTTLATAMLLTVIAVLSPRESPKEFSLLNSFWYLVCILLRAGSGYNCQSAAARFLSAVWWMFTLVLFAQYTANFAAVLTVDRRNMPFNSFEELGNQSEYKFGAILGGSTMQFFKYSRIETFRRLWETMQSQTPTAFVQKNEDGVQRVLREKYVFLMESATLDYEVTQNCNLTRVGNVVLGSNGYSIALSKGSKWREKLTRQILDLNEKGIIMMLKDTWWKRTQNECETEPMEDRRALGIDHVKGLFVLLALGLGLSVVISLTEKAVYTMLRSD